MGLRPRPTGQSASTQPAPTIITKDEDFAVHRLLETGPKVVWVRIGNTRRAELLRRVEADFSSVVVALGRGETLVEIA